MLPRLQRVSFRLLRSRRLRDERSPAWLDRIWVADGSVGWREKRLQPAAQLIRAICLALPDLDNAPAKGLQRQSVAAVSGYVRRELCLPKVSAGLRDRRETTVMAVPEAAVHEDNRGMPPENEIRSPRQTRDVQTKAKTEAMNQGSNQQLGSCVLPSDGRHHAAADSLRDLVHGSPAGTTIARVERARGHEMPEKPLSIGRLPATPMRASRVAPDVCLRVLAAGACCGVPAS